MGCMDHRTMRAMRPVRSERDERLHRLSWIEGHAAAEGDMQSEYIVNSVGWFGGGMLTGGVLLGLVMELWKV